MAECSRGSVITHPASGFSDRDKLTYNTAMGHDEPFQARTLNDREGSDRAVRRPRSEGPLMALQLRSGRGKASRLCPCDRIKWPSVASERLPDLTEISGGRSGQHHAFQLGR